MHHVPIRGGVEHKVQSCWEVFISSLEGGHNGIW